jgi:hypothetical protein
MWLIQMTGLPLALLLAKGVFTLSGNLARLPAETTCRVGLPG